MKKLFIISNESIFNYEGNFFCDNIDMKSTPEEFNKNFNISVIARKSKKIRSHKINLINIKTYGNIISYLIGIFGSLKENNQKYLIISISPFTFLACVLLRILKKKSLVYLRSDGYEEYRKKFGIIGKLIYHLMYIIIAKISHLVSCREHILRRKKGKLVSPSQLSSPWFLGHKEYKIDKIKLLYVGRIRVEKGIFSLLNIIKNNDEVTLSIVGAEKMTTNNINQSNVNIYEIETNEQNLIKFYDDHSIFILPSFTEGHPMALLESLSRLRPVIIFKEIEHVIGNKKGIFVSERNTESFLKVITHIKDNYKNIQIIMKENRLPTKDNFIKEFKKLILDSI